MVSRMLALVVLAASLLVAVSGLLSDEPCASDVTVKQNFSLADYAGRWYEMKRYEQFYEANHDCVVAEYQPTGENSISVKNGGFLLANSTKVVADGVGVISFPDEAVLEGKLNVAFFGAKPDRSNYWVLDTDYTSYSVVWSCEPYYKNPSQNVVGFWVLSRTPTFSTDADVVKRVDELVKKYGDSTKFEVPNQSDERCPRSY